MLSGWEPIGAAGVIPIRPLKCCDGSATATKILTGPIPGARAQAAHPIVTTPLRILIVEDSPDDVELLVRELVRGGFAPSYHRVDTAFAMKNALSAQPWDIVIADY